jgi:hypothetical protein
MARGRMVSHTVATDKRLNSISEEAELAFLKTIPHLDRDGIIIGDPILLSAKVCPRRPKLAAMMEEIIQEWLAAGLAIVYEPGEDQLLFFPGFSKNQVGMRYEREPISIYPPPPGYYRNGTGLEPVKEKSFTPPTSDGDNPPASGNLPAIFRQSSGKVTAEVEVEVEEQIQTEGQRGDQGNTAHACETIHTPPPTQPEKSFSSKPNEYLPGLADPRLRKTEQAQINERVLEAQSLGVAPERFRLLCDELLTGFGKTARAYAEEDGRSLNYAQKLTLELVRMDNLFRVTGGIERIFASWRENDYRGDTLPTSEQFMDHASLMSAGRVVSNRRDKSNASRKPEFGILTRGAQDNQRAAPAPTAEEIERVRAERRAAKAAGVSIQQWQQQQRTISPS